MNSWCKDFADIVFPAINEERFAVLYSNNNASRPNTPINFIIGSLMLKENNGLTDDELVESICCDVRYQYALHTTYRYTSLLICPNYTTIVRIMVDRCF